MSFEVTNLEARDLVLERGQFLATDPASGWMVDDGKLDVFVVEAPDGVPVGRWTPLLSLEPGSVLTGAPPTARGHAMLCRLTPDCKVRQVRLEDVQREAQEVPERHAEVCERIGQWLTQLLETVHYRLAPKEFAPLTRGLRFDLPAEGVARAIDGVSWVTLEEAALDCSVASARGRCRSGCRR